MTKWQSITEFTCVNRGDWVGWSGWLGGVADGGSGVGGGWGGGGGLRHVKVHLLAVWLLTLWMKLPLI